MIRCAAAVLGSFEDQLQLLANAGLTDELAERARPQAGVDVALADGQSGRNLPVGGVSDSTSSNGAVTFASFAKHTWTAASQESWLLVPVARRTSVVVGISVWICRGFACC